MYKSIAIDVVNYIADCSSEKSVTYIVHGGTVRLVSE